MLIVMCGIPGSGKSTYAERLKEDLNGLLVSRDNIRFSLLSEKDSYFEKEDDVYNIFIEEIQKGLDEDKTVIADATHLNSPSRKRLLESLEIPVYQSIIAVEIRTKLSTCIERNSKREGRKKVPNSQIKKMYYSYRSPSIKEGFSRVFVVKGE